MFYGYILYLNRGYVACFKFTMFLSKIKLIEFEIKLYFFIWISAVVYSVYCFSISTYKYFQDYNDQYDDFTGSMVYLSQKRDKSDFEWEVINYIFKHVYPWAIFYLICAEFGRKYDLAVEAQQILQISFTFLYIQLQMGYIVLLILALQPIFFYGILYFWKKRYLTWLCCIIMIIWVAVLKKYIIGDEVPKPIKTNEHLFYMATVALSWMNLKCTSFYLEVNTGNILDLMSYCFYPPTIFTGPFILYEDYKNNFIYFMYMPIHTRIKKLVQNLLFVIFWLLLGNILLHFIYVNAIAYHPQFIKSLDSWSLYGYGYTMGQFFHIKYVVLYGLSTSLASFENVKVPRLPRCIGRVHLYSDMWKFFDTGLYTFLFKYIYLPLLQLFGFKLLASLICFIFVFVWHGVEKYIFVWVSLNYIGIVAEYITKILIKESLEDRHVSNVIGLNWPRRIKCLLASPLLAISAVSNFYFFGGMHIGDIFLESLFNDNLVNYTILISVLYCCCQTSTELKSTNARRCS